MRIRGLYLLLCLIFMVIFPHTAIGLMQGSHEAINEKIARGTIDGFSLDDYLRNELGFVNGTNAFLYGYSDKKELFTTQRIWQWLAEGGFMEDEPGGLGRLITNTARASNHFHNPLEYDWANAGLDDYLDCSNSMVWLYPLCQEFEELHFTGQSSILWAQNSNQDVGGPWSWHDAREYFYEAFIWRNLDGKADNMRAVLLSNMFRALGQQTHLVEDSSVPSHVRNDIHLWPMFPYEYYTHYEYAIEDFRLKDEYASFWDSIINRSITFDKSLLNGDSEGLVPIARIVDANIYRNDEDNPLVTRTLPDKDYPGKQTIGLAEYTNANFLSKDTMFEYDELHNFNYPSVESITTWKDEQGREYLHKLWAGDTISHLARTSMLYYYRWKWFPKADGDGFLGTNWLPIGLDRECYKEYAENLIPRAVGYSAGLLEYFFRGRIDAVGHEVIRDGDGKITGIKMKIRNSTPEEAITAPGKFVVSYEYTLGDGEDKSTKYGASGEVGLKENIDSGDTSESEYTFSFSATIPPDAKDIKFWLVYRGKLGAEDDAVAAKVLTDSLEIVFVPYSYSGGYLEPKLYQFSGGTLSEIDGTGVLEEWDTSGLYSYMSSSVADLRAVASQDKILYSYPQDVYWLTSYHIYDSYFWNYSGFSFHAPWGFDSSWDWNYARHGSAVWDDITGPDGGAVLHLVFPEGAELQAKGVGSNPEVFSFLGQRESDWDNSYFVDNPSDGDRYARIGYKKKDWNLTNTWESGNQYQNTGNYMLTCAPAGYGPKGASFKVGSKTYYRMPSTIAKSYYVDQDYPAQDYMKYLNPLTLQWEDAGELFDEHDSYKVSYDRNYSTAEFNLYHSDCPDQSTELLTMIENSQKYTHNDRRLLGMLKETPLYLEATATLTESTKKTFNVSSKEFQWTEYKVKYVYDDDGNVIDTIVTPIPKQRNELWLTSFTNESTEDRSGNAVLKLGSEVLESYTFSAVDPTGTTTYTLKAGHDPSEQYGFDQSSSGSNAESSAATVPSILYHNSFDTDRGHLMLVVTFRDSAEKGYSYSRTVETPRLYIRGYKTEDVVLEDVSATYGYGQSGSFASGNSISNFTASVDKSGKYLLIGYTVFGIDGAGYVDLPTNEHPYNGTAVRKHFVIDLDTMQKKQVLQDQSAYDRTFIGFVREAAGGQ